MQPAPIPRKPETQAELFPLNVIRVETALSRFPVHRLAKRGNVAIEIREKGEDGEVSIRWKVSHNSEYGQPGPLAYKVETIVINRRVEEVSRPVPEVLKLGSLSDICRDLGLADSGKNRNHIKNAIYQNAFAAITAKVRYTQNDGTERNIEIAGTRYTLVFTGETLPDGEVADAVYLVLNRFYREILNTAKVRPLDYDYLRDLSPASQRFYELLSFQMYAALKHNRPRAKYSYSEFCIHAPQTRYMDFDRVKKQMYKVHAPHRKSGYIAKVEFEPTTDREGNPDWLMCYTPGPKARSEFRAFTKRGGPKLLEIESSPAIPHSSPAPEPEPEPTAVERELISRGVTASTARELVREFPEERIAAQVEAFDWLLEKRPKKVKESPGGYLASAIRGDYATPKGFESKADRAKREAAEREAKRREAEARRLKEEALNREREIQARILGHWESLDKAGRARLEAAAVDQAEPGLRQSYDNAGDRTSRGIYLKLIREAYIRKLLNLPEQPVH